MIRAKIYYAYILKRVNDKPSKISIYILSLFHKYMHFYQGCISQLL